MSKHADIYAPIILYYSIYSEVQMARWLFIYFSIDGYLSYSFWVTVENTVGYYILVDFFFQE